MTTAENNIRALELIAEQLRVELNEAISMYEMALENPDEYDVELSKREMDRREGYYRDALGEIEQERQWAELD